MKRMMQVVVVGMLLAIALAACATPQTPAPEPTQEQPSAGEAVTEEPPMEAIVKTIYVGPELVECEGVGPQTCMQVKDDPQGEYRLFYDQIEGFEYEEGYTYILEISEEEVENPPADASSIRWTLVSVIEKTPVEPEVIEPADGEITGTTWQLLWLVNDAGEIVDAITGVPALISFENGEVSGTTGCNSFSGSAEITGNAITFGPLVTTLMACPDAVMVQETAFLSALSRVATFTIEEGVLTLLDADGEAVMAFSSLEPLSLEGTLWEAVSYNNGKEAVVSLVSGSKITATFGEDGQVTGSASCNNYFGSYTVDGENITIGPLANTEMACMEPEGIMEQETAFLQALPTAATYSIQVDTLELRTADGALVALFQAVHPKPLVGTYWHATGYLNSTGGFESLLVGTELNARFAEDGSLSGSAGCNNYTTSYTLNQMAMEIGPVATTRKLCSEPERIMDQEAAFTAALEQTATYEIVGDVLTLRDEAGGRVAEFQAHPIVGMWALLEIQYMDDTVSTPADPLAYTVEFLSDGMMAILADCNQVGASYTTMASILGIELGPSTLAFCGEDSLDSEFLENLSNTASWLIQDGDLYLATKVDTSIMHFTSLP